MSDNITLVTETCQFCKWFDKELADFMYFDGVCVLTASQNGAPMSKGVLATAFDDETEYAILHVHANFGCNQWRMKE